MNETLTGCETATPVRSMSGDVNTPALLVADIPPSWLPYPAVVPMKLPSKRLPYQAHRAPAAGSGTNPADVSPGASVTDPPASARLATFSPAVCRCHPF